jgi:hypothetical protein
MNTRHDFRQSLIVMSRNFTCTIYISPRLQVKLIIPHEEEHQRRRLRSHRSPEAIQKSRLMITLLLAT